MEVMFDLTNLILNKRLIYRHLSNIKNVDIRFERDPECGNYYFCFDVDVYNTPEKAVDEYHKLVEEQIEMFTFEEQSMIITNFNIVENKNE